MTNLREKMKKEMNLIGLAQSTQKHYLQAVTKLYEYYGKSPAKLSISEIQNYLLYLKKRNSLPMPITLLSMSFGSSIASLKTINKTRSSYDEGLL